MDAQRVFLIDSDTDDSLVMSTVVQAGDQAQRYRLYEAIERNMFDYGVVSVGGLPGISCAFAALNYLLEGHLRGLWVTGMRFPLDRGLEDRWEQSRLEEVAAEGSLVQTETPLTGRLSLTQIASVLRVEI